MVKSNVADHFVPGEAWVEKFAKALSEQKIVESDFWQAEDLDPVDNQTIVPIAVVCDTSNSIGSQNGNATMIRKQILGEGKEHLSSENRNHVELCYLTVNRKVQCWCKLGEETANSFPIRNKDGREKSYLFAGLFAAWYKCEQRKNFYKRCIDNGHYPNMNYQQPIICLISDMKPNDETKVGQISLQQFVRALMKEKVAAQKLGLIVVPCSGTELDPEWVAAFRNIGAELKEPDQFMAELNRMVDQLRASQAQKYYEKKPFDMDDEEDEVEYPESD